MKQVILTVGLGFVLASSAIAANATIDGSADFESAHRGGATTKGKLYGLGKMIRTESDVRGTKIIMIMDTEARKMWMLLATSCVEENLTGDPHRTSFLLPEKGAKEELVGSETIDGYPADKYRVTPPGKNAPAHLVWRAKELKGFPVKVSDEAGTAVTTFRNISLDKPDAKLLEPPKGCKPMPKMSEIQKQLDQMRQSGKGAAPPAK